ncbi:TLC domain-containing protein At5g14285 [Apium graveolens]|uniref:TLC domain-containing protein At5g14285 n=1 Tax=Apium graveolens TaxID=4045 RepID=UPI003D7A154C
MEKILNALMSTYIGSDTLTLYSSPLATFIFMFLIIYLFSYFKLFSSWDSKHRADASSSFTSLAHGTPAVVLSVFAILQDSESQSQSQLSVFTSPNTMFQNMVLDFSIAYFVIDLLHYMVFLPTDILFIAHHLATLYVFATCRFVVCHGSVPILVLLILAEITSACQNTWSLAGYRKSDFPAARRLHQFLSPLFYGFYTVVRGVLGPLFVYRMGVFYTSGAADGAVPRWAWISWMCVIVCAVLLSILWITDKWIAFYKSNHKMKNMIQN